MYSIRILYLVFVKNSSSLFSVFLEFAENLKNKNKPLGIAAQGRTQKGNCTVFFFSSVLHSSFLREAISAKKKTLRFLLTFLNATVDKVFWVDVNFSYMVCKVSRNETIDVARFAMLIFLCKLFTGGTAAPAEYPWAWLLWSL